jgi:hypothetical protein
MEDKGSLTPPWSRVPLVRGGEEPAPDARTLATRDHGVVRRWAELRQARPATGEATASGPATSPSVNDGGAGIRFNFPGVGPFRDITWEEWFAHFDRQELTFVYEQMTPDGTVSHRYLLVKTREWQDYSQ